MLHANLNNTATGLLTRGGGDELRNMTLITKFEPTGLQE